MDFRISSIRPPRPCSVTVSQRRGLPWKTPRCRGTPLILGPSINKPGAAKNGLARFYVARHHGRTTSLAYVDGSTRTLPELADLWKQEWGISFDTRRLPGAARQTDGGDSGEDTSGEDAGREAS